MDRLDCMCFGNFTGQQFQLFDSLTPAPQSSSDVSLL